MKYCKVMDYSLITKLFYTFSPRLLACSRTQYRCFPYNRLDKISNSVILRAQNRKTFSRNGIVFLKRLISAIRKVQTPPLAMLSGQKSALESIQATVFVCPSLHAGGPAKAPLRFVKGSTKLWRERNLCPS